MNTSIDKKIICVVGKSGAGKSAIVEQAVRFGLKDVQSFTTRPPRYKNERGHIFITQEEFDFIRPNFIAYTKFNGYEYGTTYKQIEDSHLYIIDPYGVETLQEHFHRDELLVVYIDTVWYIRLYRMVRTRGVKQAFSRLWHDRKAFKDLDYDRILDNNNLGELIMNGLRLATWRRIWLKK